MDKTLHDLGRILLNAVPTFLIVGFLILYLRSMFFAPIAKILQRRYDETEGARAAAEESMRQAELRVAEYEEKLRAARNELYAEQEKAFRQLEQENARNLEAAKREAEAQILRARAHLQEQVDESRRTLEAQTSELADRIVSRVFEGRAA
jgi:F-type H+-transporting ATPase subunit b